MLLRSRPDTVQRFLLRETQLSTPLIKGSSINKTSEADHHSCYSGFQVQDAANFPGENRTPVRKSDSQAFSERSSRFNIPSSQRPRTGSGIQ